MRIQNSTAYGQVRIPISFAVSYAAMPENNMKKNLWMVKNTRAMRRSELAWESSIELFWFQWKLSLFRVSAQVDADFKDQKGSQVQRGYDCCRWYTSHAENLDDLGKATQFKEYYAKHEILLQLRSAGLPSSIGITIPCLNN